jgi:hypothetical protein
LQEDSDIGFSDFQNPKIPKKSRNPKKIRKSQENPKIRNPPFPPWKNLLLTLSLINGLLMSKSYCPISIFKTKSAHLIEES